MLVPPDAAELTVRFQSSSAEEVDLYVQRGREVWSQPGDAGEKPHIHADFESISGGANETIAITRESTPPLANGVYHIGLAVPRRQRRIRGTLSVEIRRSGLVRARPRALTFVSPAGSDPGPQEVRLTHETTGAVRYRIASNASWLRANPQEWVHAGTGVQEISIMANSAGMALDTHGGRLTVLQAGSGEASDSWTPTGVEIPVAFAVVPASGGSTASGRSNGVTIDSRPHNGDTYGAGEEIRVTVDFTDPVEVAGSPALTLRVGNRTRQVAWNETGWTSICEGDYKSLYFHYPVQAEDRDADGISISSDALALNGGSIRTADGTASVLALAGPATSNSAGHKVDGSKATAAEVSAVWITSRPHDGMAYGSGEEIQAQVKFSVPLEVAGNPTLALAVGDTSRLASLSWSHGKGVAFRYAVQAEDRDADGISIAADALALNGGSIRNAAGADAVLDLGSHAVVNAADHKVDGSKATAAEVSAVWITSRPHDGMAYGSGEEIQAQVKFSVPLEVAGNPTLALAVGDTTRLASLSWSHDKAVAFRYAVQAEDRDADGISIAADALALNGGSIRNAAGADAVLDLGSHAVVNAADHKVDGSKATAAEVSAVWITSRPHDGMAYGSGEEIQAQVKFSVPLEVAGTPTLALAVGDTSRSASFYLSSTDDKAVALLRLHSAGGGPRRGRHQHRGRRAGSQWRQHPQRGWGGRGARPRQPRRRQRGGPQGGRQQGDRSRGERSVDHQPSARRGERSVDHQPPHDGMAYGSGEEIQAQVKFSVPLEVAGNPTLALAVGDTTRLASLSWSHDKAVAFRYAVQAEDRDADGISIAADALALNGGSIRNAAGADAVLDLGSHAVVNAADHKVDGSKATAAEVSAVWITSRPHDGMAYGSGEEIQAQVKFSVPWRGLRRTPWAHLT